MSAYNSVNGVTMSANPLLRNPLKGEWGFDGVVISDWTAVRDTEPSANSGQDLVMPGPEGPWGDALVEAVKAGRVRQSAINEKVARLVLLASRVGALDSGPAAAPVEPWDDTAIVDLRREAAADGMVLALNYGTWCTGRPSGLIDEGGVRQSATERACGTAPFTESDVTDTRSASCPVRERTSTRSAMWTCGSSVPAWWGHGNGSTQGRAMPCRAREKSSRADS
ncbi:glycoside hydrolase family 3 N-terminal domain-containing protein [Streptomyces sp. NBC_00046]|uniref:glycoside hydrolase family 3 N-terminal domain-containing protein n=1 Tax=unclassified Streptomyces TaxID=2593676 RepID=UPI003862FF92